ncbi:pyruvate kinase [Saccharobesus litoralis]|uniref:Pyruvate kinase n=1 Tax=Saccharobesus litoralis TaxID=2172099 RepID=A0A2S0VUH8_9ALTE|nr:pyruvate kinase [Saccharobesus litoralis]AWB67822.1 pyruvate kinase [Saccharobesus litoralis]
MYRRTKIVTTLGPATDRDNNLEKIIAAGANVVRMNFSHGAAEDHIKRAEQVREIAKRLGKYIGILGDLQGPKIRVSTFKDGPVMLEEGAAFTLDADLGKGEGTVESVGLDYKALVKDVVPGDTLLLDDGRVQLIVKNVEGNKINTTVSIGGKLSNNKGINKLGGGLSAPALTAKDKEDIKLAAKIGVDFLAVSFPQSGADLRYARQLAEEAGLNAHIVAKVERAETVATDEAIDDIVSNCDVVMVARGDLGVEIGDPALVVKQKKLISRSRQLNRAVITATQMMESMIENPMPTRAEVMDVANAVLDGTDAVMLSGETAAGKYPVETVKSMASVAVGAESHPTTSNSKHRLSSHFDSMAETTALSAMYAANHLNGVKALVCLTESGNTAKLMSRISSGIRIFALSRHEQALNACAMYRGVQPFYFDSTKSNSGTLTKDILAALKDAGHIEDGDLIVLTSGDAMETIGATNAMKIVKA